MLTLEDSKKIWQQKENPSAETTIYTQATFGKIIRSRVRMHTKTSFNYFWSAFVMQVITYSLLCHVIITYWQKNSILYPAIGGVVLFIPFTIMLMMKFKKLANEKQSKQQNNSSSLSDYVFHKRELLLNFYTFKKRYEYFLTPLSCVIGVCIVFELYVPGSVQENWKGVVIVFIITLFSCIASIYAENKKSFILPIKQLQDILDEFEQKD